MPISFHIKVALTNTAVVAADTLIQYAFSLRHSPLTYVLELPEKGVQWLVSMGLQKNTPLPIKMASMMASTPLVGAREGANYLTHHKADTVTAAFLDSWEARLIGGLAIATAPAATFSAVGVAALKGVLLGATLDTVLDGHHEMLIVMGAVSVPMGVMSSQSLWSDVVNIGTTGLRAFYEPTAQMAQGLAATPFVAEGVFDGIHHIGGVITHWIGTDAGAIHAAVTSPGAQNIANGMWTMASRAGALYTATYFWQDLKQHYDVNTAVAHGAFYGALIANGASGQLKGLVLPTFTLIMAPTIGKVAATAMDHLPILKNWNDANQMLVEYTITAATTATIFTQSFTPLLVIPTVMGGVYMASDKTTMDTADHLLYYASHWSDIPFAEAAYSGTTTLLTWGSITAIAGGVGFLIGGIPSAITFSLIATAIYGKSTAMVVGGVGFMVGGVPGAVIASTAYTIGYISTATQLNEKIYTQTQAFEQGYLPKAWAGLGGDTVIALVGTAPQLLQSDVRWEVLKVVAGSIGGACLSMLMTTGNPAVETTAPSYTDTTTHEPLDMPCMPGTECDVHL